MKKILMSLLVIAVVATVAVVGLSSAAFQDKETLNSPIYQAGYIEVEVGDSGTVYADMYPCQDTGPWHFSIKNTGTVPGKASWVLTYTENDPGTSGCSGGIGPGGDANIGATKFAKLLYVNYVLFDRDLDGVYEAFGADGVCAYDGATTTAIAVATYPWGPALGDLNQDTVYSKLDSEMAWMLAKWISPIDYTTFVWPKVDDEWVLPDWARWGDKVKGNNDGYLSVYEIATLAAADPTAWTIDDTVGATNWLDPGDIYRHKIKFHLGDALDASGNILTDGTVYNDPQCDGIELGFTVTLTTP